MQRCGQHIGVPLNAGDDEEGMPLCGASVFDPLHGPTGLMARDGAPHRGAA